MAQRKKHTPLSQVDSIPVPKRSSVETPLVFISHDSRDADLAEAFANLLTDASGGILKSFRSSNRKGTAGIEYGQEWYQAIMQKLDDATDVVALLTARSVGRPWILYETGVAKGKLNPTDRVFGIALGITLDEAAIGPFAQFQNSPDEEDAITGLVLQLIRRHPQAAPREEAVRRQVQAFRETIASLLKGRKPETASAALKADETSVAKFFEEIKVLVGGVPERVASQIDSDPSFRRMRRRRFHPFFAEELFHHPELQALPGGMHILIVFSLFKDELPWLYELGLQLYRAIEGGNPREIERARKNLLSVIKATSHGPLFFEFMDGPEDDRTMMFLHHALRDVERLVRIPKLRGKSETSEEEKET